MGLVHTVLEVLANGVMTMIVLGCQFPMGLVHIGNVASLLRYSNIDSVSIPYGIGSLVKTYGQYKTIC